VEAVSNADDEATAHLLIMSALHAGAARGDVDAANTLLRFWDEQGHLEGAMYGVVMQYALEHASPEDRAALSRWIEAVTR
jgi:hypothetical protein